MAFASNGALRIHHEVLGGDERLPPLVLVFGFGMSLWDWVDLGYVARLEGAFRVIAVEPRGHGESGAPNHAEDYDPKRMASDVTAVMDHMGVEKAVVWGYSLGAKIVLALASRHPDRLAGLVLGGFEFASEVRREDDLVLATLRKGGEAWRALWGQVMATPPAMAARLAQVNTEALSALREAEGQWESLAGIPATLTAPCLLYAGERCFGREVVKEAVTSIAGSRYVERAGLSHFEVISDAAWICDEVKRSFA
ncbi:alpha/beta fold hydrolase [Chondromyces crocatus]|uniref:AB hydrolase-1 domain-containing protein n=1 Tax=Chondromyces crocatus TaxID=52 RepID=A0A0K1EPG3_CHOCO|nr:alpha/beta hydrolase [Chondromyces crocatus]AKT42699.1 uncharacterized protein CMC5_069260 [Chondromyces crocatus]